MSDTQNSKGPDGEPARPSRDPRVDSSPPSAIEETPGVEALRIPHLTRPPSFAHAIHPPQAFSKPTLVPPSRATPSRLPPSAGGASRNPPARSSPSRLPPAIRVASLEAEVERLRAGRANDADDAAGMLVRIAETERTRARIESMAVEAEARAGGLEADVAKFKRRVEELELEVNGLRQQWSHAETRLSAARETMAAAHALVEELERREETAASIRARSIRDALQVLNAAVGKPTSPPSPESNVAVAEARDPHDAEWDLELAK